MTMLEIPDNIYVRADQMFSELKKSRKDAEVFGVGFVQVNSDGTMLRLNPIGVRIDELEAMKP